MLQNTAFREASNATQWDYSAFRKPSKPTTRILPNVRTWAGKFLKLTANVEEIIRQEIGSKQFNNFNQAWTAVDRAKTGYIAKESLPRLLGELSEPFEMRIYPAEHSVHSIMEDARVLDYAAYSASSTSPASITGLSLGRLNERVAMIDVPYIQNRRRCFDQFYLEVLIASDPDLGISRSTMLSILAFYCLGESARSRCVLAISQHRCTALALLPYVLVLTVITCLY